MQHVKSKTQQQIAQMKTLKLKKYIFLPFCLVGVSQFSFIVTTSLEGDAWLWLRLNSTRWLLLCLSFQKQSCEWFLASTEFQSRHSISQKNSFEL